MKVMFVIQGEGRGHLTQALALKEMLLRSGHEVVDVMVGKSKNREIPGFFQEEIGMPITLFNSPNFVPSKENRKFSLCKSVAYNVLLSPSYLKSLFLIRRHVKESGAEMVVNFYEILCGLTFSLFQFDVPEVCIGHQYLFLHPSFRMPGKYPTQENLLRLFTQATCMGATSKLALSIRDYEDDGEQHIKVVPPLLRQSAKTMIRHHGDYILGYILNAGFYQDVVAWHEKHPNIKLHFFWDNKTVSEEMKFDENLIFHRIDDDKFLRMMAGCKAFATTAGFESVCEALYMGKPCMMIPAHVEQECNALDAEREMVGVASESFDMGKLSAFAHGYEEDVEFRMWENLAETRIVAALESTYMDYYHRKENKAYEEDDSFAVASSLAVPARRVWQG